MKVLVTGGAGYIGSHTCVELMQAGHEGVIFDNLRNSYEAAIGRIARIAGRAPEFTQTDVRDPGALSGGFRPPRFYAVVHFARPNAGGRYPERPNQY